MGWSSGEHFMKILPSRVHTLARVLAFFNWKAWLAMCLLYDVKFSLMKMWSRASIADE